MTWLAVAAVVVLSLVIAAVVMRVLLHLVTLD